MPYEAKSKMTCGYGCKVEQVKKCQDCEAWFCDEHYQPESHECPGPQKSW